MKLIKIVDHTRPWKGKDGKERPSTNFYIEFDNDSGRTVRVAIRPSFDGARDSAMLDSQADIRVIKSDKEAK